MILNHKDKKIPTVGGILRAVRIFPSLLFYCDLIPYTIPLFVSVLFINL